MSTTRATARQLLLGKMGFAEYLALTPSVNGGAAGATLIDTRWSGQSDDVFNTHWITLPLGPAGATSYEAREILDFVGSSGTFTPLTAFSAQVTTAATYEKMPRNPALYHEALNQSKEGLFSDLHVAKRDETLMVDNLLANWDFETYSAGFTSWSNVGTPTVTQETSRVWHGSNSAKIVASGAEEGLSQNLFTSVNLTEIVDKTLHLIGRVWASAGSTARLRVTFDGSTYTNSAWHVGGSEWEGPGTMYIDVAIPSGATQMTIVCSVADGGTAFFDAVGAWVDAVYRYTVPSAIRRGPSRVSVQSDRNVAGEPYYPASWHPEYDGETYYIILDRALSAGHILRVEGEGVLSTMSADTDTVELSAPQRILWITHAIMTFYMTLWDPAPTNEKQEIKDSINLWATRVERLMGQAGMRTPARARQVGHWWA